MTKNYRIKFRPGIYFPIALLMCCVPATQASAFQAETKVVESDKTETEESEPQGTDDAAKSVKKQIDDLAAESKAKMEEWIADYRAAKTTAERSAVIRKRPSDRYAKKFIEIYEANADDKDAPIAINQALTLGSPKTKNKASKILLKLIAEQEPEEARDGYGLLVKFGSTSNKVLAANKLLELSKKETDDVVALEMLKPITGRRMARNPELQKEAAELIWDRLKEKTESADLETLGIVGLSAGSEASSAAFSAILEHHADDKNLAKILVTVPSKPNSGYEAVVKSVAKDGEGDLQAQAAVSLIKYIKVRDRGLDRAKLSEEKLSVLDQEKQELTELLSTLDGDSELHKEAQSELFEIKHLSPGAEAMDIVGTDLDGSELRLSDYRGKVVFLDFWGDW